MYRIYYQIWDHQLWSLLYMFYLVTLWHNSSPPLWCLSSCLSGVCKINSLCEKTGWLWIIKSSQQTIEISKKQFDLTCRKNVQKAYQTYINISHNFICFPMFQHITRWLDKTYISQCETSSVVLCLYQWWHVIMS